VLVVRQITRSRSLICSTVFLSQREAGDGSDEEDFGVQLGGASDVSSESEDEVRPVKKSKSVRLEDKKEDAGGEDDEALALRLLQGA